MEETINVDDTPILKNANVLVATPNYMNMFSAEVHVNHSECMCYWAQLGLKFNNVVVGRSFVHFARTQLCDMAVHGNYTHIFWLDDDAIIEPRLLPTLIMHDKEVIVTPYPMRLPPHDIGVLKSTEGDFKNHESYRNLTCADLDQGLIEVDGGGTHAMLMKVDVLKKSGLVDPNLGKMDGFYSLEEENKMGAAYVMMPKQGTEDMYLCFRLKLKGVKIWCDTDMFSGHVGFAPVITRPYREAMEKLAMQPAETRNSIPVLQLREDSDDVRGRVRPVSAMRSSTVDRSRKASLV